MAQPNDPFATNSTLAPSVRDRWGYLALFGAQTIGAFVLLWTGLRLYREVLADPTSHELHPWRFVELSVVNRLDAGLVLGLLSRSSAAAAVPKRSARSRYFVSSALGLRAPDFYFRFFVRRAEARIRDPRLPVPHHSLGALLYSATCGSWSAWVAFSPPEKRASMPKAPGPSREPRSANVCYLREADGWSRREADNADRNRGGRGGWRADVRAGAPQPESLPICPSCDARRTCRSSH